MTEKEQKQFDIWQKQWDAASAQFAKDFAEEMSKTPKVEEPRNSWLTNTPIQYKEKEVEADPSWQDIYYRSQDIGGLLSEGIKGSKPEPKPEVAFGGFTPTKTNPTTQSSTGTDSEAPEGGVRVTPNWSDGDDLRELDDIKRRLEEMERKHHSAEVTSEKPSTGLFKQLESLRDRVKKLSEKINREPTTDVS